MIKRVGVVLWWIGVGILVITAFATYDHYQKMDKCVKTYAEENKWEKLRDAEKPNVPHKSTYEQFLIDAGQVPDQSNLTTQRAGLGLEVSMCDMEKSGPEPWVWGLIFALPFLILAYVLGGSFLRPPKTK